MHYCPKCKKLVSDQDKFCDDCGTRLMIEDKYLAYIAGLFDSEVAFGIYSHKSDYYIALSWSKNHRGILEYLASVFGGSIHPLKAQPYSRYKEWVWRITHALAYHALKKLHPFLKIKKQQANLLIEFCERYYTFQERYPTLNVKETKKELYELYKALLNTQHRKPGPAKGRTQFDIKEFIDGYKK